MSKSTKVARLENRVALALARANASAGVSLPATLHHNHYTNTATLFAAQSISFDGAAYTPKTTGLALILAFGECASSNAGDEVQWQTRENGVGAGTKFQNGSSTVNNSGTLFNIVPITKGTPLTVGLQATNATGGTVTAAPLGFSVLIVELGVAGQ